MTTVFDCEITAEIVEALYAHAERDYPNEACGVILGRPAGTTLNRVVPLKNVQDRYHRSDPAAFPRDARNAFRVDDLEHMRILDEADKAGLVERVLYHSHCDAGAYFSPEDRAMAVQGGHELMPGIVNVVVSVRAGRRSDMAAFRYDPASGAFREQRLPLGERVSAGIPDLALRAMEGTEAARPIRPVGGRLVPCLVSGEERERLRAISAGRTVRLGPRASRDVLRFAAGVLSPLEGFVEDADSDERKWLAPITLELPDGVDDSGSLRSAIVELVDPSDWTIGALTVRSARPLPDGRVRLAGHVFAYGPVAHPLAPDVRAEILRRGWRRVLAIPCGLQSDVLGGAIDVTEFDGLLAEDLGLRAAFSPDRVLPFVLAENDGGWLDAAIAQNLGATHVLARDGAAAVAIASTLDIIPLTPPAED